MKQFILMAVLLVAGASFVFMNASAGEMAKPECSSVALSSSDAPLGSLAKQGQARRSQKTFEKDAKTGK